MSRASFAAAALLVLGARAGIAQSAAGAVTFFDSTHVAAAFARGVPLVETSAYKIHASRRDAAGKGEVHLKDTDIIYVLQGQATFVTGGSMVDPQTVAPDEIRSARIEGGDTRTLKPGDVIIVPNGTPHWFKEVQAPFLYYTVKVTQAGGM